MMDAMSTSPAAGSDDEVLRTVRRRTDTTSMRPPTLTRASLARSAPFAVVAAVGQLSAGWPPGPGNSAAFWVSTALLASPWPSPSWSAGDVEPSTLLIRASVYIASVILLMIATGGVSSGLGSLLLIPVVGVALYGRRWESACVVALVLAAVLCVSLATPDLADCDRSTAAAVRLHRDHVLRRHPHAARSPASVQRTHETAPVPGEVDQRCGPSAHDDGRPARDHRAGRTARRSYGLAGRIRGASSVVSRDRGRRRPGRCSVRRVRVRARAGRGRSRIIRRWRRPLGRDSPWSIASRPRTSGQPCDP